MDENVVWLNISVGDAHVMQVLQSTEKLSRDGFDLHLLESSVFVDHAAEVSTWHKLHNYVEIFLPVNMFNILNNIRLKHISSRLDRIFGSSHA
jgi:hypothetical protein